MSAEGSTHAVLIALVCTLAIAGATFLAYTLTGSSALLSGAIQALVGASSQALVLHGLKRSKRPASDAYPFGTSGDLYFWSFIVAIVLFSLGAGVTIYEGADRLFQPQPIENARIAYGVLAGAIALVSFSAYTALRDFNTRRSSDDFISELRSSRDPALFTVVLENLATFATLLVALAGVFAASKLGTPKADGIASICISFILAAVAAFMSIELRSMIAGAAAPSAVRSGIISLIKAEAGDGRPIRVINEIRTIHLGPDDVLVAASVAFQDHETAAGAAAVCARLERAIKAKYPHVRQLFIEVQSPSEHDAIAALRRAAQATDAASGPHSDMAASGYDPDRVPWYQR